MKDEDKSKEQLINELVELRQRIAELEASETERKQAEEEIRQRTAQLEALREVGLEITSQLDLDSLLHSIVSWAIELLEGISGGIYLHRPEQDVLEWAVSVGPNLAPTGTILHRDEGLSGKIWETGEALVVDDYQQWEGRAVSYEGYPFAAVIGVPVRWGEEFLGVLNVLTDSPQTFSPTDAKLLSLFATQAAIAIRNARMYEQAQQEIAERKRAEEALRESKERLSTVVTNAPLVLFAIDRDGIFTLSEGKGLEILGLKPGQAVGMSVYDLYRDVPEILNNVRRTLAGEMVTSVVNVGGIWYKTWYTPVEDQSNEVVGLIGVAADITERKRAEEQLQASLREKEVLLKEIHHRVKNNLQVISSLLKWQSEYIEAEQSLEIFKESQDRVKSMALAHEQLYRSKDLARIDFAEYVRNLAAHLFRSYRVGSSTITLKVDVDDVSLGVDTAIPCGLIINELVSNALKHAFPAGRARSERSESRGEICINLYADDDELVLIVSNNGVNFPEDLDFRNTESLGLHLVTTLVGQLEGTIELDRSGGTAFKITFARSTR